MFNLFAIYYNDLVEQILAAFLRTANNLSLLRTWVAGLNVLYTDYLGYSAQKQFDVSITGQVAYMEVMLNKVFNGGIAARNWDPATLTYPPNDVDGIYIRDYANALPVNYLWEKIEQRSPVYLYTKAENHNPPYYLYTKSEYQEQADFVVMVPIALADLVLDAAFTTKMIAEIERYRMAGARYYLVNY